MKFITLTGYYSRDAYYVNIESIACISPHKTAGETDGSYIDFVGGMSNEISSCVLLERPETILQLIQNCEARKVKLIK